MTDTATIKSALETIIAGMLAKGLREPVATYEIKANTQNTLMATWKPAVTERYSSPEYKFFHAESFEEGLNKANEWLNSLPTIEQRQFREFAEILAKTIEIGKQNGIEATLVNPLEAAMKRLAKNALMYAPEAV